MAIIGSLGTIAFQVSANTVETLNSLEWACVARYATHQRHNSDDLIEFTGTENEKISFEMELSAYLGVSPETEIDKLRKLLRDGTPVPFVLGDRVFGQYRWCVSSIKIKAKHIGRDGNIESASVSVSLQEYLNS